MLDVKYQQWFVSYLVEECVKMQLNYYYVYFELVKQFEDRLLWIEVLREIYVSVQCMFNLEQMQLNLIERIYFKNLGGWFGLLIFVCDKFIKYSNIVFR